MRARVLLVENDLRFRKKLVLLLDGFSVETAAIGEEAIVSAGRKVPDLVLTDWCLPGMSAYELVGRLHAEPRTRDVPVIFLGVARDPAPDETQRWPDFVVREEDVDTLQRRISAVILESRRLQMARDALSELPKTEETLSMANAEVAILEAAGLSPRAKPELAPVMQRIALHTSLLESSLNTSDSARRLGVNPSRIRQRLTSHPPDLYGIRTGHGWLLPEFQFTPNGLVPNLEKVIARLDPDHDPVAVVQWFTSPNVDLVDHDEAISPLTWLLAGRPWEPVADLAADV